MASAVREGRGLCRFASCARSAVAAYATRGFVIAGLAGVAWLLGTATAEAAATEGPTSPDSLVPATSSVIDGAVSTSEQAARSIQSNQLVSGGPSHIGVAEPLVSELSTEAGETLTAPGSSGRGKRPANASDTADAPRKQSGSEKSVPGLVRDLTRPPSIDGAVTEITKPLGELTRESSEPLSNVTSEMVAPLTNGVNKADESVSGLLDTATEPVSDTDVTSMLAPLADPDSLSGLTEAPGAEARQSTHITLRSTDANAAFGARTVSGDSAVSGTDVVEQGKSSISGSALTEGESDGASAPPSLPLSPRPHIPGVVSGGSTTGGGVATDRGATDAGSACIGYAGEFHAPQVSRVRPDMSTMGRASELIADPAVSPD